MNQQSVQVRKHDQKPDLQPLTTAERKQIRDIFEQYHVHVDKIASRFAENHAEKVEFLSEYWTWVCEKRPFSSFDPDRGGFKQFLNTMCRNRFADMRRKRNQFRKNYKPIPIDDRSENEDSDVISSDLLPVDNTDPLKEILNAEIETQIREAIKQLPRRQQQAFILRYVRGLSMQETAEELGIGKATVKTHISKARKTLQKSLSLLYSLYKTLK